MERIHIEVDEQRLALNEEKRDWLKQNQSVCKNRPSSRDYQHK